MNIKQALEKVQYTHDLPIVRVCCCCNVHLDEQSKVIMESREKIEYRISHSYCPTCKEKAMEEIRQSKLLNNL